MLRTLKMREPYPNTVYGLSCIVIVAQEILHTLLVQQTCQSAREKAAAVSGAASPHVLSSCKLRSESRHIAEP